MSAASTPITVAHGDGIGPEIMAATLHILKAAGARLEIETIEVGEKVYLSGNTSGILPSAWDSLRRTKVFLKAPITTPQGGGYKSLNVTARKMLGLYANIRPCVSYHPFVRTKHPGMDVVIVRENEEDLYAGIEYQTTTEEMLALKVITRPGSEKIVRYAFEYARQYSRKKVTCFTKDNILKMTDGLFHKIFDEIGAEYPEIEKEHWIVDIGAAKLADTPDSVRRDRNAESVWRRAVRRGGADRRIGGPGGIVEHRRSAAMFEAIHGSAPRRAGQNMANPSGLLQGAVLMLVHIGQIDIAERVQNAWLRTIEDGVHTYDIFVEGQEQGESWDQGIRRSGDRAAGREAQDAQGREICGAAGEWTEDGSRGAAGSEEGTGGRGYLRRVGVEGRVRRWRKRFRKANGDGLDLEADRQSRREGLARRARPIRFARIRFAAVSWERARLRNRRSRCSIGWPSWDLKSR